jgi:hypothetical protein
VGAIAGGVVGGIIIIAVVTFLVWKYCMKGRRRESQQFAWEDEPVEVEPKEPSEFTMRRDARASTHTVASLASTVLTRASNIIQIAYIPGVTNRGGPTSPDRLVPPVPPIPAMVSPANPNSSLYSPNPDQHFFLTEVPESPYGEGDMHSSYARSSIAPSMDHRGSVSSTVYRSNATIGPQAQTIVRGKAAMVSVKPGGPGDTSPYEYGYSDTPPVPAIPVGMSLGEHHIPPSNSGTRSPEFHIPAAHDRPGGNTALSTARIGKPVPLNITKKPSHSSIDSTPTLIIPYSAVSDAGSDVTSNTNPAIHAAIAAASSTRPLIDTSSPSAASPSQSAARSPLPRLRLFPSPSPSPHPTHDVETPIEEETSPFADSPKSTGSPKKSQPGLESVIEEAYRRGSSMDSRAGKKPDGRSGSPFSDDNEVDEKS